MQASRGTPQQPPNNFHLLTKNGTTNAKRAAINAKYNSMKKEIQINVVCLFITAGPIIKLCAGGGGGQ
jgi:hypothetical protein